ncbi:hypothetical protein HA48_14740 [Pantoea wallisii]|uniref:Uncharacterized protein n=2 Tax=Pantoea wallisii TaxID=1076551 RepID=A0A1X1D6V0_9GAMM|nr:hypothetical protein HA48_14740 [Pantoea wallisii]
MEELYNLESVYDEQISPLMKQIIDICKEHKMPMVCSFAFENDAELGIGACTTLLNDFDGRIHDGFSKAWARLEAVIDLWLQ